MEHAARGRPGPRLMRGALVSFLFVIAAGGRARPMPLYLDDDRREVRDAGTPQLAAMADATVAVIATWKLSPGRGRVRIQGEPLGKTMGLCPGQRFAEQASAADCSGALVGPDLVLTAAHCIASPITCRAHAFVFGFALRGRGGAAPASVPASQAYGCKELLGAVYHGEDLTDWAVVRLDRPVPDHRPLELERGRVAAGAPLLVIGHPNGLPAKFAGNARVIDDRAAEFFKADLDTFDGNSGSPVFDAGTGRIVGVLSRGEKDYETVKLRDGTECLAARRCLPGECAGEDVTRVSEFESLVPPLPRTAVRAAFSRGAALRSLERLVPAAVWNQ